MNSEKGVMIIAQGKPRYINMAKNIAMSLKLSNPHLSLALVTDSVDKDLHNYYSNIIPINLKNGLGFSQKVHMYEYSPFKKTVFMEEDGVVRRKIDRLSDWLAGQAVWARGRKVVKGD